MIQSKYPELDLNLEQEVEGYNGKSYKLSELRKTSNQYSKWVPFSVRLNTKTKFKKIYNCDKEIIPPELLHEVYGDDVIENEIWKPVPCYKRSINNEPEYSVSNFGRIKHFGILMIQGDKLGKKLGGYLVMKDYTRPAYYNFDSTTCVYRFVAAAFLPNYKEGFQVHHINNNGYDCRPDNLIMLQPREHSKAHGFYVYGDKKD